MDFPPGLTVSFSRPTGPFGSAHRRMRLWNRMEVVFAFSAFFILTRALLAVLFIPRRENVFQSVETVDPHLRMITITAYLIVFFLLVIHAREILHALKKNVLFLVFWMWVLLTVVWSVDQAGSLHKSVSLTAVTFLGVYFGTRFSFDQIARITMGLLLFLTILSMFLGLTFPDLARYVEPRGEVWSGVFIQKNSLGIATALALFFSLYVKSAFPLWGRILLAATSLPLLVLSQSRTAQAAVVLMIAVYPLLLLLRRVGVLFRFVILSFLGIFFMEIGYLLVRHWKEILLLMGRDPSLTGRTLIWGLVWRGIQRKFWLGYGYKAFWSAQGGAFSLVWRYFTEGWIPKHAHNGVLELWLSAGLVGVGIFVLLYIRNLILAFRVKETLWPLAFFVMIGIYSVAEQTVMVGSGAEILFWVLFVALTVRLRLSSQ